MAFQRLELHLSESTAALQQLLASGGGVASAVLCCPARGLGNSSMDGLGRVGWVKKAKRIRLHFPLNSSESKCGGMAASCQKRKSESRLIEDR